MRDEVLRLAAALGKVEESEELSLLCGAAVEELTGMLRPGGDTGGVRRGVLSGGGLDGVGRVGGRRGGRGELYRRGGDHSAGGWGGPAEGAADAGEAGDEALAEG